MSRSITAFDPRGRSTDRAGFIRTESIDWPASCRPAMAEEPGITLWAGPKVIYVNALFPGVDLEELQIDVAGTRLMFRWFMHSGGFCGRSGRRRTRGIVKKYTHAVELPYRVDAGRVDISKESGLISIILKRDDSAPVPPASGSSDPSRSPGAIA